MSEAAVTPPPEGTREEAISFYWSLVATPHTNPDYAVLRRRGREGLTMLGALPTARGYTRRRRWLVSTHFRAPRPSGGIKRS